MDNERSMPGPDGAEFLQGLFPSEAATWCAAIELLPRELFPGEAPAVARAIERRRAEFAAGRGCARLVLQELGVTPGALPQLPGGSVQWPDGVLGTISHNRTWCGAAAVRRGPVLGIGLDIETAVRMREGIAARVMTGLEKDFVDAGEARERGLLQCLMFSAKESIYKAVFHLITISISFDDAAVFPDPVARSLEVRLSARLEENLQRNGPLHLHTGLRVHEGDVFTAVTVLPGAA